jgi:hypothetical protein
MSFDEVQWYPNVFVVLMLNWTFGKLDDTLIVTLKCGWMLLVESIL